MGIVEIEAKALYKTEFSRLDYNYMRRTVMVCHNIILNFKGRTLFVN